MSNYFEIAVEVKQNAVVHSAVLSYNPFVWNDKRLEAHKFLLLVVTLLYYKLMPIQPFSTCMHIESDTLSSLPSNPSLYREDGPIDGPAGADKTSPRRET